MISNTILGGLLGGTVGAGYSAATKLHTQDSAKAKIVTDANNKQPQIPLSAVIVNAVDNFNDENILNASVLPLTGAVAGVSAGLGATRGLQKWVNIDPTQVEAYKASLEKLRAGTFDPRNAIHAKAVEHVTSLRSGLSPREIQKVLSAITSTAPHDALGAVVGQKGFTPNILGAAGRGQQELALTKFVRELFNPGNRNAQDFDLGKPGTPAAPPLTLLEKMFGPGPLSGKTGFSYNPHTRVWTPIPRIPQPDVRLNAAAFAEMNYVPWINRLEGALRSAKMQRVAGAGAGAGTGLGAGIGLNYLFNHAAEQARLKHNNSVRLPKP